MSKRIRVKESDVGRIDELTPGDKLTWPDKVNILCEKAEKYDSMVNRVVDPEDKNE
jgi:hypothetical protein